MYIDVFLHSSVSVSQTSLSVHRCVFLSQMFLLSLSNYSCYELDVLIDSLLFAMSRIYIDNQKTLREESHMFKEETHVQRENINNILN